MDGPSRRAGSDPDSQERLDEPLEIHALLRSAANSRAMCSVRALAGRENYLSRLIGFDESAGTISLEPPKAVYIERALHPGSSALVEIKDSPVRASFESRVVGLGTSGGLPALVFATPTTATRHRRRESFRVGIPPELPVLLTIDATQPLWCELRITNLSADGVMVAATGSLDSFDTGTTFEQASLKLPDGRSFDLAVQVRHASALRIAGQVGELHVGLRFLRRPPGFDAAVAKLIDSIVRPGKSAGR
jgi:c-di-GMP-binding flagellar brake protein YcgR